MGDIVKFSNTYNIIMVKERVDNLEYIKIRKPTSYEKSLKSYKPYNNIEFGFTDGFRTGIYFEEETSKLEVADKLREIARKIEKSR